MTAPDLAVYPSRVALPDHDAREAARQSLARLPDLGRLGELAVWLAGVQGRWPITQAARPRLLLLAGDHGIAAAGVSTREPDTTPALVRDVVEGRGPVAALAAEAGVGVRVIDIAVDAEPAGGWAGALADRDRIAICRGSARIDVADAVSIEDAQRAFAAGTAIADAEIDSGADLLLLGMIGVSGTTPASVLIGALTNADAAAVTGRGAGIDDRAWMRKCAAIRDAMRRARAVRDDRIRLLAVAGGADFAAATGLLVQAAARRTPVVLDGLPAVAAALVAHRIAYRCAGWWVVGQPLREPAHVRAVQRLSLTSAVDFGAHLEHGAGAVLAVSALRTAAAIASSSLDPGPPDAG